MRLFDHAASIWEFVPKVQIHQFLEWKSSLLCCVFNESFWNAFLFTERAAYTYLWITKKVDGLDIKDNNGYKLRLWVYQRTSKSAHQKNCKIAQIQSVN